MTQRAGRSKLTPGTSFATLTVEVAAVEEMVPDQPSRKEKAEGARENVNRGTGADNPMERGSGQESQPNQPAKRNDDAGGK